MKLEVLKEVRSVGQPSGKTPNLPNELLEGIMHNVHAEIVDFDLYDNGFEDDKYEEAMNAIDPKQLVQFVCVQLLKKYS